MRVDGVAVDDYDPVAFHQQLGVVPQEAFLFSGTIRDNIAYGREDATDAEVEAAARAVGAHDFIASLPGGYLQWVSERGRSLSSGQRQLIALARAHLVDPAILLLDEATSNLDLQTEAKVQAAMGVAAHGRTTILIAHRLQTARLADRIVVIDHGRVVEDGTPRRAARPRRRATRACGQSAEGEPAAAATDAERRTDRRGELSVTRLASRHARDACGRAGSHRGGATACCTRSTRARYMDTNGDGVGDLRGIIAAARPPAVARRRRHLARPDHACRPNNDWGYDVADYCDVDPALGTLADADELIEEAATRGIRVMLDLVPNHTSDRHPWFVDAQSSRDSRAPRLVRVGRSRSPTARRRTTGSMAFDPARPAWTFDEASGQYYLQPVPAVAARPQLVERRRARRVRRHPALLVRPRRRRLPHRRVPLDHQGPRAARQPARDRGRPLVRADERASAASTTRAGPRCTTCCAAGARSPTATTRTASSSARPTCSIPSCSRRSTATATS